MSTQTANGITIDTCPVCGDPAHASESDDEGRCERCAPSPYSSDPSMVKMYRESLQPFELRALRAIAAAKPVKKIPGVLVRRGFVTKNGATTHLGRAVAK